MPSLSILKSAAETVKANRNLVRAYFELLYLKRHSHYRSINTNYEEHRDFAFAMLDDQRVESGLEIGCGEGFTTHRISKRCDRVLATDVSGVAVNRARERNSNLAGVSFVQHDIVTDSIPENFDYIFCGEVLYYLRADQLADAVEDIVRHLNHGGTLHLMHQRCVGDDGIGLDKELGARTIHDLFADRDDLVVADDGYHNLLRATVLTKTQALNN